MLYEQAFSEMSSNRYPFGKDDFSMTDYNITTSQRSSIAFGVGHTFVEENSLRIPELEPTPIGMEGIIVCDRLPLTHCFCCEETQRGLQDWMRLLHVTHDKNTRKLNQKANIASAESLKSAGNSLWSSGSHENFSMLVGSQGLQDSTNEMTTTTTSPQHDFLLEATANENCVQIHRHQDEKWNERYDQLRDFHRLRGHSVVPYHYKKLPALGKSIQCY